MEDLDTVMAIEPLIYSHPWTRGNFSDSLNVGHSAWVLAQDNKIIGYALLMIVLDEAHLLCKDLSKARLRALFIRAYAGNF